MRISGLRNDFNPMPIDEGGMIGAMAIYQRRRVVEEAAAPQRRKREWQRAQPRQTAQRPPSRQQPRRRGSQSGPEEAPDPVARSSRAVVGAAPLPRPEVVSKVWEYIKKNNLQNPKNKREILADPKLEKVFGKKSVTMFEMNKHLAAHLK